MRVIWQVRAAEFWWGNLERNELRNLSSYGLILHVGGIGHFSLFTSLFLVSGMYRDMK